ncbi:CbtA family protein [Aestuariivirga litoralis]|uniref:CbtA family protein n=1 Tax=Aestuariivirga litoralis TaxID=2650924 RepID=UPI0018C84669|nr:CbtA family protein [Aestuariivirga litoralis]MBG1231011.1 CbtA family protein [Aestuariivirga litoralis]
MVGKLLLRGMLVGIAAGILAFIFAHIFGEPMVDKAIAFEEAASQAAGEAAEPELVSRAVQSTIGLATGVLVYGAALGGIFSLVFAYVYGRIGALSPRATSAVLAVLGFIAVIAAPFVKYPASPPATSSGETIAVRTELFMVMIVASVAAMIIAVNVARRLIATRGSWNASIIGGLVFVVLLSVVGYLLPAVNEVPENFSAVVMWQFRVASIGIQLVIWTVIGLGFGWLVEGELAGSKPQAKVQGRTAKA